MSDENSIIENLLLRLQERLGHKPTPLSFNPEHLVTLNAKVRNVLQKQPMLVEFEPPVRIVGDTHGQFYDLLRLFDFCGQPGDTRYLFLGDYVDRGQLALESITLLFALKVRFPTEVWLLRGNHESGQVNQIYGFYDEMRKRFGVKQGLVLWQEYCRTFDWLPVSALVGKRILCMHGGISPELTNLDQIRQLPRPRDVPDYGLMCDILWADPGTTTGWAENPRGISFTFGRDVVKTMCQRLNIELIVRAHQVCKDGYQFFGRRMLTVFSAPNYCCEFNNSAAILHVSKTYECSFDIIRVDESLPLIYVKEKSRYKRAAKPYNNKSISVRHHHRAREEETIR